MKEIKIYFVGGTILEITVTKEAYEIIKRNLGNNTLVDSINGTLSLQYAIWVEILVE